MDKALNIGVMLSGCGVYDGSEIHESVLTLLAIDKLGHKAKCFAPNIKQHHVVDHLTGNEQQESRNVLIESARIARGEIEDMVNISADSYDILVILGGFGAAKNLTKWAFQGGKGEINSDVKRLILETYNLRKPIVSLCMGPTVVAKSLEGLDLKEKLTVGNTQDQSPYEIEAIGNEMILLGADNQAAKVDEIVVDEKNRLVSTPCYMMNARISEVEIGIRKAIEAGTKMKRN